MMKSTKVPTPKATAAYDYDFDRHDSKVLFITDLYDLVINVPTVTNDIKNVLAEIAAIENIELSKFKIMYRDSFGVFDGVAVNEKSEFDGFFSICQTDYDLAIASLNTWHRNEKVKKTLPF